MGENHQTVDGPWRTLAIRLAERFSEPGDRIAIQERPLALKVENKSESSTGLTWRFCEVTVTHRRFAIPNYFLLLTCASGAACASGAVWKSFPTGRREKLVQIRSWLEECEGEHALCQRPNSVSTKGIPKRLVYLDSAGQPPRLVLTKDLTQEAIRYATLSYRWGSSLPCQTTLDTEHQFMDEIPSSVLPNSFKDAFEIAITLGIRYIWIDALCIRQQDALDWREEAPKMKQIYSGSVLTISCCGARDTSEGFYFSEPSSLFDPEFFSYIGDNNSKMIAQVHSRGMAYHGSKTALQSRGWALQESVLSRRMVQCIRDELFWQCRVHRKLETGVLLRLSDPTYGNAPLLNEDSTHDYMNHTWWKWVESYSSRKFSKMEDRLPALVGLLDHYQEIADDVPYLGLWKRTFSQDLDWMRCERFDQTTAPTMYQPNMPSWTWLSSPVGVLYNHENRESTYCERQEYTLNTTLVRCDVEWEAEPWLTLINSTKLILRGPLLQRLHIDIPPEATPYNPPYCNVDHVVQEYSLKNPIPWDCSVQFDSEDNVAPRDWTCLLIRTAIDPPGPLAKEKRTFLILESINNSSKLPIFKRVGIGFYRSLDTGVFSTAQETEIELV